MMMLHYSLDSSVQTCPHGFSSVETSMFDEVTAVSSRHTGALHEIDQSHQLAVRLEYDLAPFDDQTINFLQLIENPMELTQLLLAGIPIMRLDASNQQL
jgi:hypothetical protein